MKITSTKLRQIIIEEILKEVAEATPAQVHRWFPGANAPPLDFSALKKQYRQKALKYHPDRNPQGQEAFQELALAWEKIVDFQTGKDHPRGFFSGFSTAGPHRAQEPRRPSGAPREPDQKMTPRQILKHFAKNWTNIQDLLSKGHSTPNGARIIGPIIKKPIGEWSASDWGTIVTYVPRDQHKLKNIIQGIKDLADSGQNPIKRLEREDQNRKVQLKGGRTLKAFFDRARPPHRQNLKEDRLVVDFLKNAINPSESPALYGLYKFVTNPDFSGTMHERFFNKRKKSFLDELEKLGY